MKKPYIEIHKSAKIKNIEKECWEIIKWNGFNGKLGIFLGRRWCRILPEFKKGYGEYECHFLIYSIYFGIE